MGRERSFERASWLGFSESPTHLNHWALKYFLLNNCRVRQIWCMFPLCKLCKFKPVCEAHFVIKAKTTISSWFRVFERTTFSHLLSLNPFGSQQHSSQQWPDPHCRLSTRTDWNRIESVWGATPASATATRWELSLQPNTQWTTYYLPLTFHFTKFD